MIVVSEGARDALHLKEVMNDCRARELELLEVTKKLVVANLDLNRLANPWFRLIW